MVCTACGYENQVGNRFCGMCGTPLPHAPLTAPGAQGTHTLTRVPLDIANAADCAGRSAPPSRDGMLMDMPGEKPQPSEVSLLPAVDMVPEIPLDEYVKSFRYTPPNDPNEVTMRGDAQALQPETTPAPGVPAKVPGEASTSTDATAFSPADDVRERLGLEDSTAGDGLRDRRRFLDFSEPARPLEEPEAPESVVEDQTFLEPSDTMRVTAKSAAETEAVEPSRGSGLTWLAVAALVAFAAIGVLEWRSQVNHPNNGPVEVVKMRFQKMLSRYHPLPQTSDSADVNAAKPAMPAEQPQSPPADQNLPANPNGSSATIAGSPPISDALAGNDAAGQPPNTTPPAVPKPKPQPSPDDNEESAVKAVAPGGEELAKANNASDSSAAAAWLWKATAKGNPDAPVRLADMYVKGNGVPRSCEQALVLLKTAAIKENVRARSRLASMYSSGTCVQRNRVEAYRWLSSVLAADPSSHWAQQNRDLIWQQMTLEERAAALDIGERKE